MALALKEFQIRAIDELLQAAEDGSPSIVLKSCTGSGKTIILTRFASDYMKRHRNAVTVWFTPGKGDLEMQSKAKMERYVHNARTKTLDDVMTEGFAEGDACFINWERLNKKSNTAMRESERLNLVDHVDEAHEACIEFFIVIDEGHTNDTVKTKEIVNLFKPTHVIRASATPTYTESDVLIEIPEDDVIAQGLIKKNIVINQDIPYDAVVENEVEFLLARANKQRMAIVNAYRSIGAKVNPLAVVQLPDADDAIRAEVEAQLAIMGITYESGRLSSWLSEEHRNLEGITELDAPQEFVIIKQAVAVGWDCPRAHILVKLRENMGEVFQIQTIGRIRRMPQACHYENEALDNCYIFTLDTRFIEETKNATNGHAYEQLTLSLKKEHLGFSLTSEQREAPTKNFDARKAFESIREHFVSEYELVDPGVNRGKLERAGYAFSLRLKDTTQSGSVRHADESEIKSLETIQLEVKTSPRTLHDEHNRKLDRIAKSVHIEYSDLGAIFRRLFLKKPGARAKKERLLELSQAEYYAFVANNVDMLKEAVREALASPDVGGNTLGANLFKRTYAFRIPTQCYFFFDMSNKDQSPMLKNVYEGYRASAEPRSDGEKRFEKYCESCPRVKWFYKNGDKGNEYFSLVYLDNAAQDPLFYPDYILEDIEGTIWIIETKGGQKKGGQSENIDRYAAKKFDALKAYVSDWPGMRMGFVRYDQKSQELCFNDEHYTEDLNTFWWKLLKDVL